MLDILSFVGSVECVTGFSISRRIIMAESTTYVRFVNGKAKVHFDSRSFTVAGREAGNSSLCCPIELVVGALGS